MKRDTTRDLQLSIRLSASERVMLRYLTRRLGFGTAAETLRYLLRARVEDERDKDRDAAEGERRAEVAQ